jgi:hypothetical protein
LTRIKKGIGNPGFIILDHGKHGVMDNLLRSILRQAHRKSQPVSMEKGWLFKINEWMGYLILLIAVVHRAPDSAIGFTVHIA